MVRKIIFLFILWRVFLFFPVIFSQIFLSPRAGYEYTLLTFFLEKGSVLSNFLLYPFANFDGIHYLLIAANGYTANAGFFPLFPLSVHLAALLFDSPAGKFSPNLLQYTTGTILVAGYFFAALIVFYKLVKLDYKKNTALWSIILLLIFPSSFFYAAIYSESLFLLLSLLIFYFARKKAWLSAGIAGTLLSATRLVGIAIFPALMFEYFKNEKDKSVGKFLAILAAPMGLIAYSFYNFQKWGNAFYYIQVQGNFANNRTVDSIILFPQTIFRYIKILTSLKPNIYEWWVGLFELIFFFFALSVLYIAWKKKIRFSYLIFGILCFLIPTSTGTLSGLPRYVLIIFPIYLTLALIKNKFFKITYCAISTVLLFIFFLLFSKGYFIA